jgi:hypothetical protein
VRKKQPTHLKKHPGKLTRDTEGRPSGERLLALGLRRAESAGCICGRYHTPSWRCVHNWDHPELWVDTDRRPAVFAIEPYGDCPGPRQAQDAQRLADALGWELSIAPGDYLEGWTTRLEFRRRDLA